MVIVWKGSSGRLPTGVCQPPVVARPLRLFHYGMWLCNYGAGVLQTYQFRSSVPLCLRKTVVSGRIQMFSAMFSCCCCCCCCGQTGQTDCRHAVFPLRCSILPFVFAIKTHVGGPVLANHSRQTRSNSKISSRQIYIFQSFRAFCRADFSY